jgi:hypothetical protein
MGALDVDFMDVSFADVHILQPVSQGTWIVVPIEPVINIQTPKLCVTQNNLVNELPSQSSWVVRNLTVGLLSDADGTRFYDMMSRTENFLKHGATTLWGFWHSKEFNKQFVSVLRGASHQAEMKLNVLFNKTSELVVVHGTSGEKVAPIDIAIGTIVMIDLVISGLWCSADRCGLRYNVTKITVHDEALRPPVAECLLD